ncbi:MAG: hypothetical protein H0U00_06690 [Actinobacteria bacterium]|nr:hypothetical protein [Actinomycetota bacterium]
MKRLLTIAALLSLVLAASAALAAPPAGNDKDPDSASEAKAMNACKVERGTTAAGRAAFETKYGTNKNKKNAFGKCVSSKSKDKDDDEEDEADEDKNATNASKKCKAERGATAATIAAFELKYGTNKNKKNAHGKCVSKHAKQKS